MSDARSRGGLSIIFSFFLALVMTTFIGVGVYTFHGPPGGFETRIRELGRQEQAARRGSSELTDEQLHQIEEISKQRDALVDENRAAHAAWGRSTSIIVIALATLAMGISLMRAQPVPVLTNGLLLGGVFTMLYGIGWIVATDRSVSRFVVITVALVITLAFGYARFVRQRTMASDPAAPTTTAQAGLAELEERMRNLEARVDLAANALKSRPAPGQPE